MRGRGTAHRDYVSGMRPAYSLSETARLLSIDVKTLRSKLRLFGISPVPSASDARARLLTREQIDLLVRRLAEVENEASLNARLARAAGEGEDQRVVDMDASQRELAQTISRLSEVVERLNRELGPRLDRLIALEQERQTALNPPARAR